jgi:DNA (cytosine-5)-methyltransferase 1
MTLYEEILFLKYNSICPYVVENVKPYYKPLIEAQELQRHLLWTNFEIPYIDFKKDVIRTSQIPDLEKHH